MTNPVLTARELMLEIKNYGIVLDIMYLVLLTPDYARRFEAWRNELMHNSG